MISLHDLTLQTPFITNNSILDVGKVSQSGSALIYTSNQKAKQLSEGSYGTTNIAFKTCS